MSHDGDREAVEARVKRLQERIRQGFRSDEEARIAIETELVGTRVEALYEGKRAGFRLARTVSGGKRATPAEGHEEADSQAITPVRPMDWVRWRRK